MAVKDDNNGAWRGDTAGHCSTFIACLFHEFAEKRLGGPGITKVRGFHHCAKDFNSQLLNACKTLLKALYLFW